MPDQPADRLAQTAVPIHPPIAQRWSPRAFDADHELTTEQVTALLEAARWAATWGGRQPVRFVVGVRGTGAAEPPAGETFDTLAGLLSRGNAYAKSAGALILVCADEGDDANTALYSAVDAGAAEAQLIIEAVSRGLIAHPMAGFDGDGARAAFGIPDQVRPLMVIAIGALADYATVEPEIAERDNKPRYRRPLAEVAFSGGWDQPLGSVAGSR
jgi:nitroreductase